MSDVKFSNLNIPVKEEVMADATMKDVYDTSDAHMRLCNDRNRMLEGLTLTQLEAVNKLISEYVMGLSQAE